MSTSTSRAPAAPAAHRPRRARSGDDVGVGVLEEVALGDADRAAPRRRGRARRGSARPAPAACAGRAATAPASTSSGSAQSRTDRAIGPQWSSDGQSGWIPARLTRPKVGFSPTMPQHRRRAADRAAGVGPRRQRHDAGRHGGSRAAARAARACGWGRAGCGTSRTRGCRWSSPHASSWVCQLGDAVTAPAAAEPRDHVGVALGHVIAVDGAAVGRADAAGVDQILPADRHARQRARVAPQRQRAASTAAASRSARSSVTSQTAPSSSAPAPARARRGPPPSPTRSRRADRVPVGDPARSGVTACANRSARNRSALRRQRPALRQVGAQPPQQRAELERMSAVAAADDDAVDPYRG